MVGRHSRVPITEFAVKIRQELRRVAGVSQAGRTSGRRKRRAWPCQRRLIWKQPMSRFRTPWARNPSAWASALRRSENQRPSPAWFTVHGHGPNAFSCVRPVSVRERARRILTGTPVSVAARMAASSQSAAAVRASASAVGRAGKDDTDKDHGREAAPGVGCSSWGTRRVASRRRLGAEGWSERRGPCVGEPRYPRPAPQACRGRCPDRAPVAGRKAPRAASCGLPARHGVRR